MSTRFTQQEIAAAEWCELQSEWQHGYPQPDNEHLGYLRVTYDLNGACDSCGVGARQNASFRINGEPRWGKKAFMQLHWVPGEFFVTPELWKSVFEPHNVACRPVVDTRGRELRTVVQLVIGEEVDVETSGLELEPDACPNCGRRKFLPVVRGPSPALTVKPESMLVRTTQYFGAGGLSYQPAYVSRLLAAAIVSQGIRGARLRPTVPMAALGAHT